MAQKEPKRLAYLIRLWQVHSEGQLVWRASLEDAHSGEKRAFGDPASLFVFLQEKLGLRAGPLKDNAGPGSGTPEPPNE